MPFNDATDGARSSGVALFDLTAASCRWPLGGLHTAPERFCGEPRVGGSPYCAEHAKRAFAGVPARRAGTVAKRV